MAETPVRVTDAETEGNAENGVLEKGEKPNICLSPSFLLRGYMVVITQARFERTDHTAATTVAIAPARATAVSESIQPRATTKPPTADRTARATP
jgi:hypothetical protein